MFWCKKTDKSNCVGILKTLLGTKNVKVELSDGLTFIDEVVRIHGEGVNAVVVLGSREISISSIAQLEAI
jgi:hypothetical protein